MVTVINLKWHKSQLVKVLILDQFCSWFIFTWFHVKYLVILFYFILFWRFFSWKHNLYFIKHHFDEFFADFLWKVKQSWFHEKKIRQIDANFCSARWHQNNNLYHVKFSKNHNKFLIPEQDWNTMNFITLTLNVNLRIP